jgi:hypothetical protein
LPSTSIIVHANMAYAKGHTMETLKNVMTIDREHTLVGRIGKGAIIKDAVKTYISWSFLEKMARAKLSTYAVHR